MILVTGATGNVGRPLVEELAAAGAEVRAVSRNPAKANLPEGVEVVDNLSLDGVSAAYFVLAANRDGPGELIKRAKEAGTKRIVALSTLSVRNPDPNNFIAAVHRKLETAIEESGLDYTFIRAGGMAMSALEWAPSIRAEGIVRGAYGQAKTAPVHERDVAAVSALALLKDDFVGARPMVTGPEALPVARQAEIIGEVIGKPVRFEEISPEEALKEINAQGLPPGAGEARLAILKRMVDHPHPVAKDTEELTGKPARTFAQWAADHAPAFK